METSSILVQARLCLIVFLTGTTLVCGQSAQILPPVPSQVVVVCPNPLRNAILPWLNLRREQGYQMVLLFPHPGESAEGLRTRIMAAANLDCLHAVVLFGDVETIPTFLVPAQVNIPWGEERDIATDNLFADRDGDRVPDFAIGRIPLKTEEAVADWVQRTVQYEQAPFGSSAHRQVNFIAGAGGFGSLTDSLIETTAKKLIQDGIPGGVTSTITFASWASPYCPDPRRLRQCVVERIGEPSLFWVYMGHGHPDHLDRMTISADGQMWQAPLLESEDVSLLSATGHPGIGVLLACYCGAFDRPDDCLAERLLAAKNGPIALLCGSRVTLPYSMSVLGTSLMDGYFQEQAPTLGQLFLGAKRSLADNTAPSPNRRMIDSFAKLMSPTRDDLAAERLEHIQLFNLLGDPLLPLRHALPIHVQTADYTTPGGTIAVVGTSPIDGTATIQIACRRDRLKRPLAPHPQVSLDANTLAAMDANYAMANDDHWLTRQVTIHDGKFATELTIPAEATGATTVRVMAHNDQNTALGSADFYIQSPPSTAVIESVRNRRQ